MLESPVADVLAAAACAGIARVVTVGVDVASSRWAAECAAAYPDVYAAVAIHPSDVPPPSEGPSEGLSEGSSEGSLAEIRDLAGAPKVVAVGETGLDYYWDSRPREDQRWWFRQHIQVAKDTGKALMIHDRDAHEDVLRILAEEGPPDQVVFHCFSGDAAMAKQCADAGYVMSFAGTVTFKNASALREAASVAPAELILVETDAPFLTPMPNRGKPNSPAMAAFTMRYLAGLKGIDLPVFCDTVRATAQRVFGWD
jgi:TatD DNase family protein